MLIIKLQPFLVLPFFIEKGLLKGDKFLVIHFLFIQIEIRFTKPFRDEQK